MCIYDRTSASASASASATAGIPRSTAATTKAEFRHGHVNGATTTPNLKESCATAFTSSNLNMSNSNSNSNLSLPNLGAILIVAMMTSAAVTLFSLYFPFWLAPEAARKTYHLAFYHYDNDALHHFDTTAWTYGTDYGLAFVMLCYSTLLVKHSTVQSHKLVQPMLGLIVGYAISTTAGALAHQNYWERVTRNTWHFRILWTLCVGTVTYASTSMGSIASQMAIAFQPHTTSFLPHIPTIFWKIFGIVTTLVCACGWFSYQRPACDIFIAGITQFPSSFYMMIQFYQLGRDPAMAAYIRPKWQWIGILAFIANAPLLPLYPLLVQYTDWSLAQVNTFLHTWLLITWSLQALSLHQVQRAVNALQQRPHKAVPVPALVTGTAVPMKKDS